MASLSGFCSVVFEFNKTTLHIWCPQNWSASALRRLLGLREVAAAAAFSGTSPETLREEDGMDRESGGTGESWAGSKP